MHTCIHQYKWINLLTLNNNVICQDYKHNSSVKYHMYNKTVQWTQGFRATPSSQLSPLVCLSLESGAGIDTPPFGTIMRPELELRSMSVIPIPAHAYKMHSSTDSIIPETRPKSRCANLMRMSKMRGFCMTGNRLQFRINLMPIRNCNKVIYNIKLWLIYIKIISTTQGTYWCYQIHFIYKFT